jgi:hypothetical protein
MKDNKTQLQQLHEFLKIHLVTASMASAITGISQKNICRYKRRLEKEGLLTEVFKGKCLQTGRMAWYVTCRLQL